MQFVDIPSWSPIFEIFFASSDGQGLKKFLDGRRSEKVLIYPPDPFFAFRLVPLNKVKVVILGQDPYHGEGQAHGMAFSVMPGVKVPPSLRNIFKELERSFGIPIPKSGYLKPWADQGVLLLNTILTVEQGKPMSHAGKGWEKLTDSIIQTLADQESPKVFLLWGKPAQNKRTLIEEEKGMNLILESNHPSPLSANRPPVPFLGNDHFVKANAWLEEKGVSPVNWDTLRKEPGKQGELF